MPHHFSLMIPGAEPSGEPAKVVAPYDQSLIGTVDRAGEAAVEQATQAADRLFRDRTKWIPQPKRIEILLKAAEIMKSRREELAKGAAQEGGKPLVDSLVEIDRAVDGMHCCVETLRTAGGSEIPMNVNAASASRHASTHFEPRGPVLAFSAFNHPLNLIVHQVAPAIATGCPVLIKPAQATPLSCFRLVEIFREAGLPAEWCQAFIVESHAISDKLVADKRFAFFSYIGSGRIGWKLRSQLAPGTRCTLEHGGAAPVIVTADADISGAIPLLGKGGFYHAGQVCVSVQRVYADRSVARDIAEKLAEYAATQTVGDPTANVTDIGPLIRPGEVDRVAQWVNEAKEKGAEVICGGEPISETCYAPTVLLNPPDDIPVSKQEIFGPVVCVYEFDDLDEAIDRANDVPFSFQASVFTSNLDTAFRASRRLNAAAVMVNDHTAFRVDWMPFAGLRESGLGIGGIPHTMADMQVEKLVVFRSKELEA